MSWMDEGACKGQTRRMFPFSQSGIATAKDICSACPVIAECLAFALDSDELFGVWGGTSEEERRRMRVERQRAKPPARCGTLSRHAQGCRCLPCRSAWNAYLRQRRAIVGRADVKSSRVAS